MWTAGLRIHGGVGYTKTYPIERIFRDVRSFHFEEGTTEIKLIISAICWKNKTEDPSPV